jgi:hypothetical protein
VLCTSSNNPTIKEWLDQPITAYLFTISNHVLLLGADVAQSINLRSLCLSPTPIASLWGCYKTSIRCTRIILRVMFASRSLQCRRSSSVLHFSPRDCSHNNPGNTPLHLICLPHTSISASTALLYARNKHVSCKHSTNDTTTYAATVLIWALHPIILPPHVL